MEGEEVERERVLVKGCSRGGFGGGGGGGGWRR